MRVLATLSAPWVSVLILSGWLLVWPLPALGPLLLFLTGMAFAFQLTKSALNSLNIPFRKATDELIRRDAMEAEQLPAQHTGIDPLDELLSTNARALNHFIDTLREFGETLHDVIERYERLTNNIAVSVIIEDSDGEVTFCSPYTEVLTGYSTEEIQRYNGDFLESIVIEEDIPRYKRFRMMSEMGEAIPVRYRVRHKSGIILWLETRLVPVLGDSGNLASIMSVSNDVTSTVRYQKHIEEQNQDLSDFAYMVSHDLKAPIFTIRGMASALSEDYREQLGEEGTGLLSYITEGATRLEKLVASIIEYSSLSKNAPDEVVSLNSTLSDVLRDLSEQIKLLSAEIHIKGELPEVLGPPMRLYQVFSNLLGNALKYHSPERRPLIEISVCSHSDQNNHIIQVKDNGSGIADGKLDDVFRPYHRACGSEIEGSGIGLACVKKIMERLGGSVSVRSKEGEGSSFYLVFPTVHPKPQSIPEELARCFQ